MHSLVNHFEKWPRTTGQCQREWKKTHLNVFCHLAEYVIASAISLTLLANSVCWPKLCAQIRLCEQKPFRPRITVGRNKMQHYSCGRWLWFWFAAHFACCPLALRIRPVLLFCACVCVRVCVCGSSAGKFHWT